MEKPTETKPSFDQKHCEAQFICTICLRLAFNPVQCPYCEIILCKDCIDTWMGSHAVCPGCRMNLTSCKDLSPELQKMYETIRVFCPNRMKGCHELIYQAALDFHLSYHCMYEVVPCSNKNNGCKEKMLRINLLDHLKKKECKFDICYVSSGVIAKDRKPHALCTTNLMKELDKLKRRIIRTENEIKMATEKKENLQKLSESVALQLAKERVITADGEGASSKDDSKETMPDLEKSQFEVLKNEVLPVANPFEKKGTPEPDEDKKEEPKKVTKKSNPRLKTPKNNNFCFRKKEPSPTEDHISVICKYCQREFRQNVVERHEKICMRSKWKNRGVFDSKKQRLPPEALLLATVPQ